jgi:transcriptional regulator with PAS, ATPase and Fis domain
LHALSSRKEREYIPFNCAAIPRELIESQLFGHRRGSFTGATSDFPGVIRAADGGTLLLDEIGDLPLEVQPKLLRFLQEGEVHPVGATQPVKADVRIIAATNRNPEEEIRAGHFRADLFERLNQLRLQIPPLRQRREEIAIFTKHFLYRYQDEMHKHGLQLSDEVMELLVIYDWPRNVRQLANEIWRLVLKASNNEAIGPELLSQEIRNSNSTHSIPAMTILEFFTIQSPAKGLLKKR